MLSVHKLYEFVKLYKKFRKKEQDFSKRLGKILFLFWFSVLELKDSDFSRDGDEIAKIDYTTMPK